MFFVYYDTPLLGDRAREVNFLRGFQAPNLYCVLSRQKNGIEEHLGVDAEMLTDYKIWSGWGHNTQPGCFLEGLVAHPLNLRTDLNDIMN